MHVEDACSTASKTTFAEMHSAAGTQQVPLTVTQVIPGAVTYRGWKTFGHHSTPCALPQRVCDGLRFP